MIGFACEERCPYCRMVLGTLSVEPTCTVLHSVSCRSNRCRGRLIVFRVRDGRAHALTEREQAAILEGV